VEFEVAVEINLVQIGTNEFFPQLIRLAANERLALTLLSVENRGRKQGILSSVGLGNGGTKGIKVESKR
jgi:hypothetical protein